jgi:hypothetical protein
LFERVRGSLFRAARLHREDFAEADRKLRKSPAEYRFLPAGVATATNPAYIDSTTKRICLAQSEPGRTSDCCRLARREHEPGSQGFEDA